MFERAKALMILRAAGIFKLYKTPVQYVGTHGGDHLFDVDGSMYAVDLVLGTWRAVEVQA